ncbi:MAG: M20/M25/M40 family metallo-hydrolase [Mesorhizobium sp.]|nr:MAG: M20/M25/M40 family metallo-hydrolase [Mesorhizobium sp.]
MQSKPGVLEDVLLEIDGGVERAIARLSSWLSIPSISTDPTHDDDCREAAGWLVRELSSVGIAAELRETGGHPIVVGKGGAASGARALFYGHYDVQPIDPLDAWETPPFAPRVKPLPDGRKVISARGACDDKGQIMTFVEACRAWKAVTGSLPVGVTFLIEGAEEDGSKFLPDWVATNRHELSADFALVCDTCLWDKDTPCITTSLRGLLHEEVTVCGPSQDLHSGLYGGAARNPIRVLGRILGDLHRDDGSVAIPGFYDGVEDPPGEILASWRELNPSPSLFLGNVGLSEPAGERDRLLIEQVQSRPTCEANGIIGGYTGVGTKTVIPARASVKISFRLVGNQDPQKISAAFRDFVRERVPGDCSVEFVGLAGSRAVQIPFRAPVLAAAKTALRSEWGKEPVLIGSGGSIPIIDTFKHELGLDTLLVGFGLDDDCVHAPNEKYDLRSLHKGARTWARILAELSGQLR